MKKAKVILCSLLLALTSFSAYGALPPLFAEAGESGVSVELGGSFSERYFGYEGADGAHVTPALGMEARYDWAQNQIVSYREKLTGNFSVAFSLITTEADWWDLSLYFGADSPNVFTSQTQLSIGHSANGLYGEGVCSAARLYEPDGVTKIADGVNLARDLAGNTAGSKVYFRFSKVSDTRVEVYYGYQPDMQQVRCVVLFDEAIPDGYFCIVPFKRSEIQPFYLYLDDLSIAPENGGEIFSTDFSRGIPADLSVDGDGMEVLTPAVIDAEKDIAYRSLFTYAATEGKYFDVSFSYRRYGSLDTVFMFGGNRFIMGAEEVTLQLESGVTDTIPAGGGRGTVALTLSGDTLTVAVNKTARTYRGVSAAGAVSFERAGTGAGGTCFSDIAVRGNAEDRVLSIEINEYLLKNAAVGGSAQLSAKVNRIFGTGGGSAPRFSVVSGGEYAVIEGNDIRFKAEGEVTLTAEVGKISDTVTFAVAERSFTSYSLDDSFTELNEGNFTARDPRAVLSFNSSVVFTNDRADRAEGYEGAKLVTNTQFVSGNGTLFDLSFSPYVTNVYKGSANPAEVQKGIDYIRLNKQMSFGVLLGMKSRSASLSECIYLRINPPSVELYVSGVKIPASLPGNTNSNSYMDHDDPNYMRLVARGDGVLEVYLGNASNNINELFATYEGLDMDGYVAFTANCYNTEQVELPLAFKNIALTGNVERNMNDFDVLSVKLDKTKLNNAVVSPNPIALQSKVTARPNLTDYHDVKYSVSGGGARVEGDKLYINTADAFTLRVTSRYNQSVYDECEVVPKVLKISDIAIQTESLQNLNVYSQPVLLLAVVTSNYSYIREFNEVTFTVLSGNAELFTYFSVTNDAYLTQLRVTGSGEVVLRATSKILETVYQEVRFTVTDPEADTQKPGCGCNGNTTAASVMGGTAVLLGACAVVKRGLTR